MDKLSYHITFSAAASGTFTVQARNGKKDSWYNLVFAAPLTISAETVVVINLLELPFQYLRLQWGGDAACAGTLTAVVGAKSVGN